MTIKIIKTEEDYNEALKLMEELISKDPDPDSEEGEKLHLLATLIEDYESKTFPESFPDPVDAILFRMEQQNLKPIDLIPYIGSRSKVSEILSRKRPLTISMIRSLEDNLGIPAKVLLKEVDEFRDVNNIAWERFPIKEMVKRNCFDQKITKNTNVKQLIRNFFGSIELPQNIFAMLRKTHYRTARPMDKHALLVWTACVIKKANKVKTQVVFNRKTINLDFMQKIAKFSMEENGPILAQEFLKKHGIILIIEPHFPQTYLDGATIIMHKKNPVIGLTIRHNRLDNFWFTLMHELAHLALHCEQDYNFFYDDLDNEDKNEQEQEADQFASESLIPQDKWENSPAKLVPSPIAAESLARELGIHTAIVAGRMRYEGGRYIYLNKLINKAKARKYFPDEKWDK